ncbi:ATPase [Pseudogracilibacillus auburnensis]|uniref:ATPase n=1 Tax=Pseudogracilibacillus auburnensis TaxID=1494959 RepID=UPI001A96AF74|nr:ATPase [Pseudogracilibacillus auburnensis]MBO1003153.1 ATPase [Pseudogracilibacillus auburnensis]
MQLKFKTLSLKNFKSHADLTVEFGDTTQISGENAKGKSSIGEAITFLLYGLDLLGSKLDPTPVTYESDLTSVTLLSEAGEKDIKLGREIVGGRNKYIVNDVPKKATEFNDVVEQLFDKDLFLSLFNPNYFFTLHWEKQREMVLMYVTAPVNKEVFAELPKPQAEKLAELVKKHSLDDLNKIHRENRRKKEKEHIATQSRTKTLKEQLDQFGSLIPTSSLNTENSQNTKQLEEINKTIDAAGPTNNRINELNTRIKDLYDQRDHMKKQFTALKDEPIEDHCRTCKQPLQDESIKAVEEDKEKRISEFKEQYNKIVVERKGLESELSKLEFVDVTEQIEKSRNLQDKIFTNEQELNRHKQLEQIEKDIKQAQESEKTTKESLNNSIFIVDSIKDFHAKEAELQVKKVQDLFENLSIRLFDVVKSTGELKPTFEIQMDGKDYRKLSLSESIKAGLELRDVLSEQSGIVIPCFVDNAESITKFKEPNGQLIMAQVVAGKELEVVSE